MTCLDKDPKGKDYEDYIAAHFQSTGNYYVEKNVEKKERVSIFELDVIATDYSNATPNTQLIEVKSGTQGEDRGFRCLFKVRGWMDYLGLKEGQYISGQKINNVAKFTEVGKKLCISVISPINGKSTVEQLKSRLFTSNVDISDIDVWSCVYLTERKLIDHLRKENASNKNDGYTQALYDYYFQVNNDIFFLGDNIDRINSLFDTYSKVGHISARVGNVLCGGLFSDDVKVIPEQIYAKTYYGCECTDINLSTYIENRARLAILKNAIDYILKPDQSAKHKLTPEFEQRINKLKNQTSLDNLKRYPIFWQWFLWVFGGFILEDYKDQEFELLSKKTGISVAEIPNALRAYDILFPLGNRKEWLQLATQQKKVKLLSVFCVPFMGIGVKYRQSLYKDDPKILEVLQKNEDLNKWADLSDKVLNGNCWE